ncbi:MAG: BNR-repeat neuraminidase N-terminal domain-containing protein, partial [Bacteroidota bacterium]
MSFFATATATVKGDLTIQATNTGRFKALTSGTLTINGNLIVNNGTFEVASSSGIINTVGVTLAGGTLDLTSLASTATLKVSGTFNQTGGTLTESGTSTTSSLEFNGISLQSVTIGTMGTGPVNFRINNAADISLSGTMLINSTASLTVSNGHITGSGTVTYNATSSKLTYNNGTAGQTANALEFPAASGPVSLTISSTGQVVTIPFSRSLAGTAGVLTLTAGILDNSGYVLTITNSATGGISGGSATAYVKGALVRTLPLSLVSGSTYTFPIGKAGYNPFALVNPTTNSGGTVTISAEVFDANSGGTSGSNMGSLNTDRYWAASIISGGSNFTNTFIKLNDASVIATSAIGASATLAGAYDIVGSSTPTVVVGTSITSAGTASTSLPGYYVIGIKSVAMAYTSSTTTQAVVSAIIKPATNQQMIGMQIVTTGNASPLTLSSLVFNTTGCTSPAADIANARVWSTGTSATFATTTQFGSDFATPSGPFTISGTQALSEGTNYFWLVYDVPSGATVNDLLDAECTSINYGTAQTPTVTAPTGTRIIKAALNGLYSIGASQTAPNYTTLTNAITDINAYGVSGAVTFQLMGDYAAASETYPLVINAFTGASASNTLTIKPATGVTATITGSVSSGALIKLNGADYVILDGSNSGGTDRSLTITNSSTTSPTAVSLVSLGTGTGATSNTIKNCNISTGVSAAAGYGIAIGGNTPGTGGADNDNVTVQNNNITIATVSIYAAGTTSVSAGGDDNLQIIGNTVNSNSTIQNQGIQVGYALSSSITGNSVSVTSSGAFQPVGISLETGFVSSTVTKNLITNVLATNTGGYGGRGITVGTGTASSGLTIANNVIYGVNGSNWSGFSNSSSMGIAIGMVGGSTTITTTAGGINLYFNSVNMTGSMGAGSTTAITAALYIGTGASALNIRDNIFANSQVATSTTQRNYGIYSDVANTAFTTINNNDYYVSNSFNAASAIPGFLTSDRLDLAGIQSGFGSYLQSIVTNPLFSSNTDLRPGLGSPVVGAGENPNTTGITTDYLSVSRGTPPSMGAYENAVDVNGPTITYTVL